MRTFPVPTSRRIKGFTLVELLIVILLISIFITFASVNWNVATKRGKEALLEDFSIKVALIREDAISHYENRVLEFDVSNSEARVGRLDVKNGFVETGLLHLPEDYRIKDVVINGEAFPQGKCYVTFHASGMVDRTLVHLEGSSDFYSLLINPLTAKVTGKDGYIEEISAKGRNNPS
jgi:prepilin-type N-terminal cleavage/methylation domain-containing protein